MCQNHKMSSIIYQELVSHVIFRVGNNQIICAMNFENRIRCISIIFNFGWYSFTAYYAQHGGSDYLSAKLFPFWDLSPEQIEEIKAQFKLLWREDFFSEKAFNYYFVLSCLALPFILLKKIRFSLVKITDFQ